MKKIYIVTNHTGYESTHHINTPKPNMAPFDVHLTDIVGIYDELEDAAQYVDEIVNTDWIGEYVVDERDILYKKSEYIGNVTVFIGRAINRVGEYAIVQLIEQICQ